jgi:hypothetical protein
MNRLSLDRGKAPWASVRPGGSVRRGAITSTRSWVMFPVWHISAEPVRHWIPA